MRLPSLYFLTACFLLAVLPHPARAQSFSTWLEKVRQEALAKGISQETVNTALADLHYLPQVIKLDQKQPESKLTFPEYKKNIVTPGRIEIGQRLLNQHEHDLRQAGDGACHVPPEIIVSLWGMETNYGRNTGGFGVVPALATLAYDGRRSAFFRDELFRALTILDEGHVKFEDMRGSWAGAMGQNQFMPSSFQKFAVDGDGDGKKDIWNDLPDVFASTANYLCESGWQAGEKWGYRVTLSQKIPPSLTNIKVQKTITQWKGMGVEMPNGKPLRGDGHEKASIVIPKGSKHAFLVSSNYRVIMSWNSSTYFATAIGLLADEIARQSLQPPLNP